MSQFLEENYTTVYVKAYIQEQDELECVTHAKDYAESYEQNVVQKLVINLSL